MTLPIHKHLTLGPKGLSIFRYVSPSSVGNPGPDRTPMSVWESETRRKPSIWAREVPEGPRKSHVWVREPGKPPLNWVNHLRCHFGHPLEGPDPMRPLNWVRGTPSREPPPIPRPIPRPNEASRARPSEFRATPPAPSPARRSVGGEASAAAVFAGGVL